MKFMKLRHWANRGLSSALVMALVVTYSMVSLGAPSKPIGELTFSGGSGSAAVTVNGEAAKSGRTLFSDSTISTPENVEAILSLGRAGKIRLGPNTTFSLSADPGNVAGSLISGNITVLSSLGGITVKNLAGELVKAHTGESVAASASSAAKQAGPGGLEPWHWALIIGAVVAVVVIVAASGGGDSTPASPIR